MKHSQRPSNIRWKRGYYIRHNYSANKRRRRRFTQKENRMIILSEERDVNLARIMRRSLRSIQIKRGRLRRILSSRKIPTEDKLEISGLFQMELVRVLTDKESIIYRPKNLLQ